VRAAPAPSAATADFDLRGRVGLRLVDAGPRERASVIDQLGPIEHVLDREPDITIRFVDRIEHGRLTYVDWPDVAFDERSLLVLSGKGRARSMARIPFEDVGARCEIECERGAPAVPLLIAIVNATALARGVLPLHASAFVLDGRGVLVTGWSKGGKTEALLACMAHGATYVGDEWVYLTSEGLMFGIPEPIRLWRWHVRQRPEIAARVGGAARARMAAIGGIAGAVDRISPVRGGGPLGSLLRRGAPVLRRQANVRVPPSRLFGPDRLRDQAPVDEVLLVSSHDQAGIDVDEVAGAEVAARMLASLEHERHPLVALYQQFRFAFPDRRSDVIERSGDLEARLLGPLLGGRRATWIRHPYPCDLEALYQPIAAAVAAGRPK
jgi:hypothetical protein